MALAYGLAWSETVSCPIERRIQSRAIAMVRAGLVTLLVLDAGLIAWLLAADGGAFNVAGVEVSVRGVRNPLTVAWVLGALTLLTWWRLPVRVHPMPAGKLRGLARTVAVMAVVFSVLTAPLIVEAVRLARAGRYVSQIVFLAQRAARHRSRHARGGQSLPSRDRTSGRADLPARSASIGSRTPRGSGSSRSFSCSGRVAAGRTRGKRDAGWPCSPPR